MRSLMPRWMRLLPFADFLAPLYYLLIAVALAGTVGALMGEVVTLVFVLPLALFVFLLWRSHIDDGYKDGNDGVDRR